VEGVLAGLGCQVDVVVDAGVEAVRAAVRVGLVFAVAVDGGGGP
jgi:hypothetical protein